MPSHKLFSLSFLLSLNFLTKKEDEDKERFPTYNIRNSIDDNDDDDDGIENVDKEILHNAHIQIVND